MDPTLLCMQLSSKWAMLYPWSLYDTFQPTDKRRHYLLKSLNMRGEIYADKITR